MWKTYFKEFVLKEKNVVNELLMIDELISYDLLLSLIDKEFELDGLTYDTFLLEGSSIILLNLIDKLYNEKKNIIICTLDNYSLNTYIIKKYIDFIQDFNIENSLDINIVEHFKIADNNILSIGSESFNNEMKSIYKNINSITFEL